VTSLAADAGRIASPPPRTPSPALRPYLDAYRGYHYIAPASTVHRGLPSSALTVVLAFGRPLDVGWHGEPSSRGQFWSLASGLHVKSAEIFHEGEQCGIQLGLTAAGARALLGVPMSALVRGIAPLDSVLTARMSGWHERVASQPTWERRYDALEAGLLAMLAARHAADAVAPRTEITWAWDALATGRLRVDAVAREIGWSRRHLATQFAAEVGLGPKQFARVGRFERSRAAIAAGTPASDVAAACGFADQAHLTREWQAMSGYTPTQWLHAEFPFLQDLTDDDDAGSAT
jgi:AraC-like DNA-binding protein